MRSIMVPTIIFGKLLPKPLLYRKIHKRVPSIPPSRLLSVFVKKRSAKKTIKRQRRMAVAIQTIQSASPPPKMIQNALQPSIAESRRTQIGLDALFFIASRRRMASSRGRSCETISRESWLTSTTLSRREPLIGMYSDLAYESPVVKMPLLSTKKSESPAP